MAKTVFPPLYAPGIHLRTLDQMEAECVTARRPSVRRPYLLQRLKDFLDDLHTRFPIPWEVWIDGSFLSEKPEPDDIDLVILVNPADLNALDRAARQLFSAMTHRSTVRARYDLDVLVDDRTNPNQRMYWRGCFGFAYDDTPKGFIHLQYP